MGTKITVFTHPVVQIKEGNRTTIKVTTLGLEHGDDYVNIIKLNEQFKAELEEGINTNTALIQQEALYRVDGDSATAQLVTTLESETTNNLNTLQANIESELTTLTNETTALAQANTLLSASVNDLNVELIDTKTVVAGQFTIWDGVSTPKAGNIRIDGNIVYQYINGNWVRTDLDASNKVDNLEGWVAGAKSIVTDPVTGDVTGWEYWDGSGITSEFKISADNITLDGTTTFLQPNDPVSDLINDVGYINTFYQGTVPTSINIGDIWYNTNDNNKAYRALSIGANQILTGEWELVRDTTNDASLAQATLDAGNALDLLDDISADSKITPSEKVQVNKEWTTIQNSYATNLAQASTFGVPTTNYTSDYNTLSSYITPILSNLTTTSNILRSTFDTNFTNYYEEELNVLNQISVVNKAIADGKVSPNDLSTEGSTTINGGNITTGTINAVDIDGVNITGVNITGSTVIGSTIKTSDTATRLELSDTTQELAGYKDDAKIFSIGMSGIYQDDIFYANFDDWLTTSPITGGGIRLLTESGESYAYPLTIKSGYATPIYIQHSPQKPDNWGMYGVIYANQTFEEDRSYGTSTGKYGIYINISRTSATRNTTVDTYKGIGISLPSNYDNQFRYTTGVSSYVAAGTGNWSFYAGNGAGNYGPFTGAHEALILKKDINMLNVGDIVVDTGNLYKESVSNTVNTVKTCMKETAKEVIGVCISFSSDIEITTIGTMETYFTKEENKDEFIDIKNKYGYIQFNALGEGCINVCGMNGDIEVGDLITSSSIAGKGMKQDDDIIRSYTVGKAREDVVFEYPEQVKQIACVYYCG